MHVKQKRKENQHINTGTVINYISRKLICKNWKQKSGNEQICKTSRNDK